MENNDLKRIVENHIEQAKHFKEHLDEIEAEYGKETYIVMKDKQIVDTGLNESELIKKYPQSDGFYISSVKSHLNIPKDRKRLKSALEYAIESMPSERKELFLKLAEKYHGNK